MADNLRRTVIVVIVMFVMVTAVKSLHGVNSDDRGSPCQQMRGECRAKTYQTDDEAVFRNVSCYCTHGEEVSQYLETLGSANCMNVFGEQVDVSILHIVGCNVTSQAPLQSLLNTFRRTSDHMELYVEGSGWLSLASPSLASPSLALARPPHTITATFLNSNMSGMPADVVSGAAVSASVVMEGCQAGVLDARSFSGYGADANVTIAFRDTKILTVKKGAFDLPRKAQMEVRGGEILKFEGFSYSGGAELTLDGVKGAILLQSALSIYGLKKLSVTNCSVAAVYFKALGHRPPSYARNITIGGGVEEGSEATFSNNKFMEGNGQAFAQLCNFAKIKWHNNTVLTTNGMPLRVQGPECSTPRNWSLVFSFNSISCERCTDFANPDAQTCALFASSYCISCETPLDGCYEPVLPYVTSKCQASHPDLANALRDTCPAAISKRTPKALYSQSSGDKSAASLRRPLALGVALCVSVLLCVAV